MKKILVSLLILTIALTMSISGTSFCFAQDDISDVADEPALAEPSDEEVTAEPSEDNSEELTADELVTEDADMTEDDSITTESDDPEPAESEDPEPGTSEDRVLTIQLGGEDHILIDNNETVICEFTPPEMGLYDIKFTHYPYDDEYGHHDADTFSPNFYELDPQFRMDSFVWEKGKTYTFTINNYFGCPIEVKYTAALKEALTPVKFKTNTSVTVNGDSTKHFYYKPDADGIYVIGMTTEKLECYIDNTDRNGEPANWSGFTSGEGYSFYYANMKKDELYLFEFENRSSSRVTATYNFYKVPEISGLGPDNTVSLKSDPLIGLAIVAFTPDEDGKYFLYEKAKYNRWGYSICCRDSDDITKNVICDEMSEYEPGSVGGHSGESPVLKRLFFEGEAGKKYLYYSTTPEFKNGKPAGIFSFNFYLDKSNEEWEDKLHNIKYIDDICKDAIRTKTYTGKALTQDLVPTVVRDIDGNIVKRETIFEMFGVCLQPNIDVKYRYENNINAGTAKIVLTGIGKYYGTKTYTFRINKAAQTLKVSTALKTVKYSSVRKARTLTSKVSVTGAKGAVTYAKVSGSAKLTIGKTTGKITVKKGTKKGTYSIKIKVTSAATANYKAATKTVTVKVRVK